jgi:hypothetical protein
LVNTTRKPIQLDGSVYYWSQLFERHNALVSQTADTECPLCLEEEDQTSFHIFAECPALARTRLNVLGEIFLATPLVWSVKQLSSFLREAEVGLCDDLVREDN